MSRMRRRARMAGWEHHGGRRSAASRLLYLVVLAQAFSVACDEDSGDLVDADGSLAEAAEAAVDGGEQENVNASDAAAGSAPSRPQMRDSDLVDGGGRCLTGTSPSFSDRDAALRPPGQISTVADYLFPDATLTDWVSYVDQLAIVTVLSEEEIPPRSEVFQRGEGYIGRSVFLHIDETVWLNKASTAQAGEVQVVVFGWILADCVRYEARPGDAPRVLPGGRYIVPLVNYSRGVGFLTDRSVMAFPGEPIATGDVATRGQNEVARRLSEMSTAEMAALLMMTPPDPVAEQYCDLPPEERVRAVAMTAP